MKDPWLHRALLLGAVSLLALLLHPMFGIAPLFLAAWILWVPERKTTSGRAVFGVLVLFLVLWILHQVRWIVYPLVAGMLIAYWLDPLVDRLEGWKFPRALGAAISLLPIGAVIVLVFIVLVPTLLGQIEEIANKAPDALASLRDAIAPHLDRLQLFASRGDGGMPPWLERLLGHVETLLRATVSGVTGLSKGVTRAFQWLGMVVLTPVLAYYLLVDWDRIRDGIVGMVPPRFRPTAEKVNSDIQEILPRYLRGQFVVAAIQVVLYSVGFFISGLEEAIALGFLAGIFSLVPVLGFWITVTVVLLSAVIAPDPIPTLAKVAITLGVVQFLEGQVLVPRIQGTGLGLHPFLVLLAVLTFGLLFGFVGVVLAVPILAVGAASWPRIRENYLRSGFYEGASQAESDAHGS
ncbi:MAG: AI-2E family transporter [Candidatus Eisenbacteria bacterium]|uniref:AI-2E family transporter n=1 Tax=Eiseniibacteriota bacterium TaxID=2212470 RepID=A0A956SE16_UNCEI|nr:AI-2E family transporter [Candidatus Eisenbacteria bacterium]MCB9462746.1 AI-2E family transporter [Candidatus Eisenbacteria bacterium]